MRTAATGLPVALEFLVCHVHGGWGVERRALWKRKGKSRVRGETKKEEAAVWGR